jgi:hypothetical protein
MIKNQKRDRKKKTFFTHYPCGWVDSDRQAGSTVPSYFCHFGCGDFMDFVNS